MAVRKSDLRAMALALICADRFEDAAALIWPHIDFNPPQRAIFNALHNAKPNTEIPGVYHSGGDVMIDKGLCVMGHAAAAKTFTSVMWALMWWWKDPKNSIVGVSGATALSMKQRAWGDLMMLWRSANERLGMPGKQVPSGMMIRADDNDDKHAIVGVAAEHTEAHAKIQGLHSPRVMWVFDEADNKQSQSLWGALPSVAENPEFRFVALANPQDPTSKFGQACTPQGGWDQANPETDTEWVSAEGFRVLRLDGLKSPNILAGKDIYPYLLTNGGLRSRRQQHGEQSLEWWAYVRGWFPTQDIKSKIFPDTLVSAMRGEHHWYGGAKPVASLDPAAEGGDTCQLAIGLSGLTAATQMPALWVSDLRTITRTDKSLTVTEDYCNQVIRRLDDEAIEPGDVIVDTTGLGLGFADYLDAAWARAKGGRVVRVGFNQACTTLKILAEDAKPASERFDRFVSELWFAAREWTRVGLVKVRPDLITADVRLQMTAREYRYLRSDVLCIETKAEMKARGHRSPDAADAICMLVHMLRKQGRLPSAVQSASAGPDVRAQLAKLRKRSTKSYEISYGKKS